MSDHCAQLPVNCLNCEADWGGGVLSTVFG